MRKKFHGIVSMALIFIMSCAFVGCGGIESIREDQTQLYIQFFDGGFGNEFYNKIAADFEEEYKEVQFEDGKKGVQVIARGTKTHNLDTIGNNNYYVVFDEEMNYSNYAPKGTFLDISDIVDEILPNEEANIASKLSSVQKQALTATDGKYYALPHYQYFTGMFYDMDLFELKRLYIADNKNNENNGFVLSATDKRSAGPDGKYETEDDGLPVSYEEFFKLCSYMSGRGVTPFIWTGQYKGYITKFLRQLAASYDAESYYANYSFSGNSNTVTGMTTTKVKMTDNFSLTIPQTTATAINPENGYMLSQSEDKYYALSFLEAMLSNPSFYHLKSFSEIESHLKAQEDFVYSRLDNEPVAMIIDGNYWENEARESGVFDRSYDDKGDIAKNRRFGVMPVPTVVSENQGAGKKATLLDNAFSYVFINAAVVKEEHQIKVSKEFLKFCYRQSNLDMFTKITGGSIAADYDISQETYDSLTPYRQSVWNYFNDANVIYQISANEFSIKNNIGGTLIGFQSNIGGAPYNYAQTAIKKDGVTAAQFFAGLEISKEKWETDYVF